MKQRLRAGLAALGIAVSMAMPGVAETNFPQRDIRIVVPYSPGGGFDTIARIIAEALPRHLPNKVHVVVENVPGAGGRRGVADINRAAPDGHTIGIVATTMILADVAGEDLPFDIREMTQFGQLSYDGMVIVTSPESKYQTIADLKAAETPVRIAASQRFTPSIVASLVDFPFEVITGYTGAGDFVPAVLRGDVDITINTANGFVSYVRDGQLKVIGVFDQAYESVYPEGATVADVGVPDLANVITGRFMMGPPGIPEDVQKVLNDALSAVMTDPEVQEKARIANAEFDYAPPAEVPALLAEQWRLTEAYAEFID